MKKVRFHSTVKGIVAFQNRILLLKRRRPFVLGLGIGKKETKQMLSKEIYVI